MNRIWRGLGVLVALVTTACSDGGTGLMGPSEAPPTVRAFDGTGGTMTLSGATIATDKADYAPGEIVTMSGSGWEPGETVVLTMTEDPVTDGLHQFTVVADAEGDVVYAGFSPGVQHLGVTFTIVATGQTSGQTATTVFTDGNVHVASQLGSTFTVSYRVHTGVSQSQNCSNGTPTTQTAPITTTSKEVAGINGQQSVRIVAPAANDQGATFDGWLNPEGLTLTAGTLSDASICVQGFAGNGIRVLTAKYVTPPGNTAPDVDAGADDTIDEGDTFTGNGSFTDPDANTWTATVDYGEGAPPVPLALTLPAKTFALSHTYAQDGSYTVTVCVSDGVGLPDCDDVQVTVNNVAPVVDAGADDTIDEGDTFTGGGSFTDPGADDPWSATVDYGDGSESLTLNPDKTFSLSHVFPQDGPHTVTVCVYDDHTFHCDDIMVTVNNVAPVVDAGADDTIDEGDTFTGSGSFTDPGADPWTATVDYGDGTPEGPLALTLPAKTFSLSHTYADNGGFTVTVCVKDDHAEVCDDLLVTVNNVPPTITSIAASSYGPLPVTAVIQVTGTFTDPGLVDTHTLTLDCNGGAASALSAVKPSFSGTCSFVAAGVYEVTATVTDKDGGSDSATTDYIVVYDPSAGFVTGGGWIDSPASACRLAAACEGATGKANLGFVSKYLKGATVPTGNTEFQFKAGGLDFKSTSYQWLVVSGARGQYKGYGDVNGTGGYGFLVTAIDGQLAGGGGTDRFRIKIWRTSDGVVVYDNQMGADEVSSAATALSGGSIVIHAPKK